MYDEFDVLVSESTVSRTLKQMAWNRKMAIRIAQQRNQSLRDEWMIRMGGWKADQLIFLDESAACEHTSPYYLKNFSFFANCYYFR